MSKSKKYLLVICSTALYILLFAVFRESFGASMSGVFLLLPVLAFSWAFGLKGGVLFAVFSTLFHFLAVRYYLGEVYDGMIPEHVAGALAIILVAYLVGYLKDSHNRLLELEKKTRILNLGIEKSEDIIYVTDSEGTIKYANPAFTKIYGYQEDEWKGKTPRILKSGFRDQEFYKDFWQRIKKGESVRTNMRNMTKDGRILEIESSVNPIIDERGEVLGFLAIQRDVTEKMATELELKKRAEDLAKLNELMVDRELKMVELKKELAKNQITN